MSELLDIAFESPLVGLAHEGKVSIHDYTRNQRWGFRGKDVATALGSEGWRLPEKPNSLLTTASGILVMALSLQEFWFLNPQKSSPAASFANNEFKDGLYPLFCQSSHAWLVISGEQKCEMMAKLCGIDLSPAAFAVGDVAQTQMALVNCIVARHELDGSDVFSMLVDQTYAAYVLEVLLDARSEFL